MEKKVFFLLLTSMMLGSCQPQETSSIEDSFSDEISSSENDSSSSEDVSSSEEVSSDDTSSEIDESLINEVKRVTDFLGDDNDVYRINITTTNNEFPVDKENYVSGYLNVTQQDTSIVKNEDMPMKIKLRGNSTLAAAKKPFKIKFESKQSLFGLKKAKDYVLLANYFDKSNLRNYLAYLTANKMTNLDFQPSSIFVDVYFNNQYYGLFLLAEQIEAKEGRVDIEKNVSDEGINSFLIEADERAKDEYAGYQGKCYISSGKYDFALKYPDADDYVEAYNNQNSDDLTIANEAKEILGQFDKDTSWLQSFMDETSSAIHSGKYRLFSEYIDVDSFIDYYLVQEMFKNVDVGSTSQFYVIDQKSEKVKLTAGPVWDFDIASGVVDSLDKNSLYYNYTVIDLFTRSRDYYYASLFKDVAFEQMVAERYTLLRDVVFAKVLDELNIAKQALSKAQERNVERWPLDERGTSWIETYAMSDYYCSLQTLEAHYEFLETKLNERLAIMDDMYLL